MDHSDDNSPRSDSRIRLLVVEDQPQILKNQLRLLESVPEIVVVSTATSGESALQEIPKCAPEVLLLDLGLPKMSGIDVTREVKRHWPKIEILIFTIFDEENKVFEAIKAGASGYLLKGAPIEKIVGAILDVHAGGTVIQPNLARELLNRFRATIGAADTPLRQLSEREQEILQLLAKGITNEEMAGVLGLSRATIRTHIEHIYKKLEVTNRVEAVAEGLRKGLIRS